MNQETKIILSIGVITTLILVGAAVFLGKTTTQANDKPVDPQTLVRADSHKIATDTAKITLVEFGDFECPACGATYPTVSKILNDYKGKINFVFRNFPLTGHKNAVPAANAAEAAGTQGKYWEMYNKLYETQNDWSNLNPPTDQFVKYAQDLGIDADKFRQDMSASHPIIEEDQNDGDTIGVNATPTFYINGQKFTAIPTYENFKTAIDPLLK